VVSVADRRLAVAAWESLYRAQVHVLRRLLAIFPDGEMTFNEYDVLLNLSQQPERQARIRDLNRNLLLAQPTVSRMLDRLVARDLVTKHPDPTDARGTIIRMTEHGQEAFRRVAVRHAAAIAERMSVLEPEELTELARITDKLRGIER